MKAIDFMPMHRTLSDLEAKGYSIEFFSESFDVTDPDGNCHSVMSPFDTIECALMFIVGLESTQYEAKEVSFRTR
jgi:hypothetical protein